MEALTTTDQLPQPSIDFSTAIYKPLGEASTILTCVKMLLMPLVFYISTCAVGLTDFVTCNVKAKVTMLIVILLICL